MFVPTYFSTEQGIDSGTDKGVEIKEMLNSRLHYLP